MTANPFRAKAEERAKLCKKDEDDTERPAKRMCNQYEKQMAKMSGDLQIDLLEYVASFRGEHVFPGHHPAALVTEVFASESDEHNKLHCQQLEAWYQDYATKIRKMPYLFKTPTSVVVDPSMDNETVKVPIVCLKFTPPEDGLPVTDDWCTTFESMLFGGVELGREPLDVSLKFPPGQSLPMECHCMDQVKGWTRSSAIMTILVAASELDLSDEKAEEQLRPLFQVLDRCWMVAFNMGAADRSFRNISLSFRGSERQPPSALQLALRFSRVLEQAEAEGRHHADMTTEQRLQDVVADFNQTPGLHAKHRIEEDRFKAVLNLLSGTSEESRDIIRQHLDTHKWYQSAFSTEQFKGSRWMLTASPKAASCPAELRRCLTVTPRSQSLHLRLVVKMFTDAGRRMRPSARGRARLSSSQFDQICDFACVFAHVWTEARALASWTEEKDHAMEKAFFQRDYITEIEAAVTAKLSTWKPEHLSLWVDLVQPPAGPAAVATEVELVEMEDQAQAARYREISAKLAQDVAAMTGFNAAQDESTRRSHVVNVMHQKAQMTMGKQLCESFMEKNCRLSLVTKKDSFDTGLDAFLRSTASSKKVAVGDVDCILYFDCTKLGVLTQGEVNLIGDYAEKILFKNTKRLVPRSVLVLLPPLLVGTESAGTLRGDLRFCTSQLWLRQSLQLANFPKALDEKSFVVPGEAFLSHDTRRSLTDLQETAQWLGGQAVPQSILEALTGDRKNFHGAVVVHPTLYDGCVEMAGLRLGHLVLASSGQPLYHNSGKEIVKNHLVEAWKAGRFPMDKATPRYKSAPAAEEMPSSPAMPELKVCQMADGRLTIPRDVRQAFLSDPVWSPDWREQLKQFDADWGVAIPSAVAMAQGPSAGSSEVAAPTEFWKKYFADEPATFEALKTKCSDDFTELAGPDSSTSFVLAPGPALFVNAKEAVCMKNTGTPLVCHGAGTWLLGDKAEKFQKDHPGKGIACAWTSDQVLVVVEALQGAKGVVDYTLGGHHCARPPSVQQGREADCFEVRPDPANALVWKPNNVSARALKAANVASSFSSASLEASPLQKVWRLRFWTNEKCIAPAKPLYFLPCDLELQKGSCKRVI
ncbi:unnamed protein product [Cladocopium goreaui]|uniref:Uncharacterized protein n=1 Tax=Cladocopium goreaui TaxID=2562237 RepID=A0A9P1CRR2_9DINO|nr:unnamed protein product [Cladocopium goreaui]